MPFHLLSEIVINDVVITAFTWLTFPGMSHRENTVIPCNAMNYLIRRESGRYIIIANNKNF